MSIEYEEISEVDLSDWIKTSFFYFNGMQSIVAMDID